VAVASCAVALALSLATLAAPASGSLSVPGRAPAERFAPGAHLSSLPVPDAAAIGARTNGRVFAAAPGRGAYTCSGTALNTPSRSVVITAGHCILDGGVRATELRFVPAYRHGARPFGTFRARSARVMEGWRLHENTNYDLGALIVRPNALGRLTDVVGARGWATGRSRLAAFEIFGYPAGALGGRELRTCAGVGLGSDPHAVVPGPPPVPGRCDMAAGASGGGWLVDGQYLNGVTSYSYTGAPRRLFSPYFGVAVAAFLRSLP
jgi:hypothetical protein